MTAFKQITPEQWVKVIACAVLLVPQGILLFRDAQKRGRFPWLWGLWGLISFPLPSVVYYFFVIRRDKKKKKMNFSDPSAVKNKKE